MIIAGIDYSMSCPAISVHDTSLPLMFDNLKLYALSSGAKKYLGSWGYNSNVLIEPQQKEHDSPETRYLAIADWTISILVSNRVEEVVLEGYALGASAGLVFNIAENTSVLKQKLRAAGIKFTTPSPSVAKKRLSGKGNSKKPDMCQAFTDKFGVSLSATLGCKPGDTPENDLVDATANLMTHPMLVNS